MKSSILEKRMEELTKELDEQSNRDDLYKSIIYPRSFIFKMIYMTRECIVKEKFSANDWKGIKEYYFNLWPVEKSSQTIRDLLRNIISNYKKDKDKTGGRKYKRDIEIARTYYRKCVALNNNIVAR